jgi:hypothetical protein
MIFFPYRISLLNVDGIKLTFVVAGAALDALILVYQVWLAFFALNGADGTCTHTGGTADAFVGNNQVLL